LGRLAHIRLTAGGLVAGHLPRQLSVGPCRRACAPDHSRAHPCSCGKQAGLRADTEPPRDPRIVAKSVRSLTESTLPPGGTVQHPSPWWRYSASKLDGHRSISPNTMSSEPMIAATSASMCPRVRKSIAERCANEGARILHLYGRFVPSAIR